MFIYGFNRIKFKWKKLIIFSLFAYSINCLILNIVLSTMSIVIIFLLFNQSLTSINYEYILYPILAGPILDLFSWIMLFMARNNFPYFLMHFMTNCASTCIDVFIYFHKNQKTEQLAQGFKSLKKFENFTSWFWIYFLIYKNDKNVQRVFVAFKKFVVPSVLEKMILW